MDVVVSGKVSRVNTYKSNVHCNTNTGAASQYPRKSVTRTGVGATPTTAQAWKLHVTRETLHVMMTLIYSLTHLDARHCAQQNALREQV